MIKNIISRLHKLLIYIFKEVPIILLLEVWTIVRVLITVLMVLYIIMDRFFDSILDMFILNSVK